MKHTIIFTVTDSYDPFILPGKHLSANFDFNEEQLQDAITAFLPAAITAYNVGVSTWEVVTRNGGYTADVVVKSYDRTFTLYAKVAESNHPEAQGLECTLTTFTLSEANAELLANFVVSHLSGGVSTASRDVYAPGLSTTSFYVSWHNGGARVDVTAS